MEPIRINVYLVEMLGISRRQADREIQAGNVKVDGRSAELGQIIDPKKQKVFFKHKRVEFSKAPRVLLVLYKPRGYVSTRKDPQGRKTVMDLLPKGKRYKGLKPAGRLDYESEGLLLFSNDGKFIQEETHPKYEHEKEYIVQFERPVVGAVQKKFLEGVTFPEGVAKADEVRKIDKHTLSIVLHQGFNRQIRRMANACNNTVTRLVRIRSGDIKLGKLKPGEWKLI